MKTKRTRTRRGLCLGGSVALAAILVGGAPAQPPGTDADSGKPAADTLRELADLLDPESVAQRDVDPAEDDDYYPRDEDKEALGKLLFFDKILSGNRNISCATCHHPLADTGDGLSLSVGEGANGLGVTRNTGLGRDRIVERVPRNAPHVFNLGAIEFTRMFHDGRVEPDPNHPSGFRSPAGDQLPIGLENVLAVQAMFPVTSLTEMAGQEGENPVANAAAANDLGGPRGVWARLARRLQRNRQYARMFVAAFDDIEAPHQITFVHAANAIAAFEAAAYRASDSPFDRYLRGDRKALTKEQDKGRRLFYGAAGCADCHSGTFQTDHEFYAIAMPQVGPGKGDNLPGFDDGHDDFGRERVTDLVEDRFRFRVPSLRNVALTGPWGHDGAYNTLEAIVNHVLDPVTSMYTYDPEQCVLPSRPDLDRIDFIAYSSGVRRGAIASACELSPTSLSEAKIEQLIAFLHALTDPASIDLRDTFPMEVPSGLPVFE